MTTRATGKPAKLDAKKSKQPKQPKQAKLLVAPLSLEEYFSTSPIQRDEHKCYLLTKPKK